MAFVLVATLMLVVTGVVIARGFYFHVTVPCQGILECIPTPETLPPDVKLVGLDDSSELVLQVGLDRGPQDLDAQVINKGVAWRSESSVPRCNTVPVELPLNGVQLERDGKSDRYYVMAGTRALLGLRAVDRPSRRYAHEGMSHLADIPLAIWVISQFGVLLAVFRLLGARRYATRTHAWTAAKARPDGAVESESGELIGRLDAKARRYDEALLLNPDKLARKDAYRDVPLIEKRDIAWGGHARWTKATTRALRDSRVLSVLVALTTSAAVVAYQLAG